MSLSLSAPVHACFLVSYTLAAYFMSILFVPVHPVWWLSSAAVDVPAAYLVFY